MAGAAGGRGVALRGGRCCGTVAEGDAVVALAAVTARCHSGPGTALRAWPGEQRRAEPGACAAGKVGAKEGDI